MDYSTNFKKVIKNAEIYSDGIIHPFHLLLGVLTVKDSSGYKVLSKLIDVEDAENKMNKKMNEQSSVDVKDKNKEKTILSPEAENILMQCQLEAKKFKSSTVKTNHLVLALTRARAIDIVSYKDVESVILNMDKSNSNMENTKSTLPNKKGKTPLLDEFSTDLTKKAMENKLDPIVGRKNELRRIAQILSRRKKNNPVLIGDPGCVIGETLITIKKISDETNHEIIIIKNDI